MYRLPDGLEAGEVNDRSEAGAVDDCIECALVPQVGLVELDAVSGQLGKAVGDDAARVDQVVDHHDLVTSRNKLNDGVTAYVAGAACDEDPHIRPNVGCGEPMQAPRASQVSGSGGRQPVATLLQCTPHRERERHADQNRGHDHRLPQA